MQIKTLAAIKWLYIDFEAFYIYCRSANPSLSYYFMPPEETKWGWGKSLPAIGLFCFMGGKSLPAVGSFHFYRTGDDKVIFRHV